MPKLKYKKDDEWIDLFISEESKVDISSAVVTLSSNSYTYDGTQKQPTVTSVVLDSKTLTIGTDYEVTSSPATNAGAYTIAITGVGNYEGIVTVNWTIDKAQATISGANSITITGIGESQSETYTTTGDGAMSFSIGDSSIATVIDSNNTATLTSVALGTTTLTVSVAEGTNYLAASKTVNVEIESAITVFGVMWDYSLSSPALTRLTPESDPLEVVTNTITTEPTACIGSTGGQSEFDNYLPWSGMIRKNYVNGQVVDFVDYSNGETYVYIPEFWSKIINDTTNSRMYFYIADSEVTGFTKHLGSNRYVSRYECNSTYESKTGYSPKTTATINSFRTGITAIDNSHFQYDFYIHNAIQLLYIIEFANLNSQVMIGAGISNTTKQNTGQTDTLTYHTGRNSGTDSQSAVQYRWIENLWGNVMIWTDGVKVSEYTFYICDDYTEYSNVDSYISIGLTIGGTYNEFFITSAQTYDNLLFPKSSRNGSGTIYLCDTIKYSTSSSKIALCVGGAYNHQSKAGIFQYRFQNDLDTNIGGRSMVITSTNNEGD